VGRAPREKEVSIEDTQGKKPGGSKCYRKELTTPLMTRGSGEKNKDNKLVGGEKEERTKGIEEIAAVMSISRKF